MDAVAVVELLGKPTLFITMTANTKWPEITAALPPNFEANDRPDIVSRVFVMKLKALLHDIRVAFVFVLK